MAPPGNSNVSSVCTEYDVSTPLSPLVPLYHYHYLHQRSLTEGTAIIIALTVTAAFFTLSCLGCWGFARWDRRRARRMGGKRSLASRGSRIPLRVPSDANDDDVSGGGGGGSEGANGMRVVAPRRGILWTPPPTLPELPPMVAMEMSGDDRREDREMERLPGYEEVVGVNAARRVARVGEDGEEEGLPLYRERDDAGEGDGGGGGGGSREDDAGVSADIDNAHIYAEFMTTTVSILQDYEVSTESLNQYLSER